MKQILQNMRDGKTSVVDLPVPSVKAKMALVQTRASLVSAGTERMLVEFSEKNLVGKASSRPDLVKQVMNKAHREGILPTIAATFNKLDQPLALGYSSCGVIVEAGQGLQGFKTGDRVACAGGNYAVHAEYSVVPQNLLTLLPSEVDDESAAFTTLGAIAMQGFRLSQPQVGESVCIIGLGLLGMLTAEIAQAAGCRVFGVDLSAARVELAVKLHIEAVQRQDCEKSALAFSRGRGFDHVLICADSASDDPVELAGVLARDKGSVVAVGAVGLSIPRKTYYEKELDLKISRSYGPGRYDPNYEENGVDYPFGYVRWTEGRNLQSFVDLLAQKKIDLKPLITHRFKIEEAPKAYELITGKSGEAFMGVLIAYPQPAEKKVEMKINLAAHITPAAQLTAGVLGAGNYAQAVFIPVMKKTAGVQLAGICSAKGMSAVHAGKKYGFGFASSSEAEILGNEKINTVVVLTRHDDHARQVTKALENHQNVYCEKPLALTPTELESIEKILARKDSALLTVGFNRRFAPLAIRLKQFIQPCPEPLLMHYRVNAGFLPDSHWLHDPLIGGGRIVGEGCHFIDLLTWLAASMPVEVSANALPDVERYNQDNVAIHIRFANGSIGILTYLANGNRNYSKERIEIFAGGKIAVLDDFRTLEMVTESDRKTLKARIRQDKGHLAAWQAFVRAIQTGGPAPIPYEEISAVHRACFAARESVIKGTSISL